MQFAKRWRCQGRAPDCPAGVQRDVRAPTGRVVLVSVVLMSCLTLAACRVAPDGCPDTQAGDAPCRLNAAGKPIKDETLFVDGSGPPRTLREMKAGADAVVVVRYTGMSHEVPGPAPTGREELPRYERLGVFELLEVLKSHSALPTSGRFEIVVPGSYQEFPRYILHRSSDGVDEPQAERTFVIFLHYSGPRREGAWRSKWSEWSFYDVSGDHPKALASRSSEPNGRTTKAFLEALRAR